MNMNRRDFLRCAGVAAAALAGQSILAQGPGKRLNMLLITADDLYWRSLNCFGGKVPGLTPNMDRLAAEGVRFEYGHVTVAVCQPSRSVMMTGRYPHHNGAEGFEPVRDEVPTLIESLKKAGYLNGILGKVVHLAPPNKFQWDMAHDQNELGAGRNPDIYYKYCQEFFARAKSEGKPFFLMANSHDPHRPFCPVDPEAAKAQFAGANPPAKLPSRMHKPEEIPIPGFLADLPEVRLEQTEYNNSARRCDDTIGKVLQALKEAGAEDNTLVIFLSDNGISMPFAKSNCYLNSTRTPLMARWPGVIEPGRVDKEHFVSGIDLTPTFLDAAGVEAIPGVDGTSFVPVLRGQKQAGRESCYTVYHRTSGENAYPMRCVQTSKFGYIFNFWSDGKRVYKAEPLGGRTFAAMVKAAAAGDNPDVAARVKLCQYREREELYDRVNDPDSLKNLAGDPKYAGELEKMRALMQGYMEKSGDPALETYKNRGDEAAIEKFMTSETEKAVGKKGTKVTRKAGKVKAGGAKAGKKKAGNGKAGRKKQAI